MNVGEFIRAFTEFNEQKVYSMVKDFLELGYDPKEVIEMLRKAMGIVGKKYAEGEFFLSELVMAGEIFKQTLALLKPAMMERRIVLNVARL